jgi:S-adenosyl-L-methionine hydrolase (adenosine-forming)
VSGVAGVITFSSDYGPHDEFAGVCRAVIAKIAPDVRVIDLAHGIRGLRAGAAALAQSIPFAPPGIHLAIVDPGVGTDRRGVVVVTDSGSMLVGPDNGLLIPAANILGGAVRAFELSELRYRLVPTSATFHGRDVFAPAAAHLGRGVAPEAFGPPVGPSDLRRLPPPLVGVADGRLTADVLRRDWFGNLQLAATQADLRATEVTGVVSVSTSDGHTVDGIVGRTFADAEPGGLVVFVDSAGFVAVAINGGSADERLGAPDRITVSRT